MTLDPAVGGTEGCHPAGVPVQPMKKRAHVLAAPLPNTALHWIIGQKKTQFPKSLAFKRSCLKNSNKHLAAWFDQFSSNLPAAETSYTRSKLT